MANLCIVKDLTDNRYTVTPSVTDLTTTETALVDDFGDPVVTLGGAFDVTSTGTLLNLNTVVGTFAVGETITGGTSSATAVVVAVGTNLVYYNNIVGGPFTAAETITGAGSSATAVVVSTGSTITQFEIEYGVAPESTEDFTYNTLTRAIVNQLPVDFVKDGDTYSEARENSEDLITHITNRISAAWTALTANVPGDNFEGKDVIPL
jgi:hypothetical protein